MNIIDLLKGYLSGEAISAAAGFLGESTETTSKAFGAAVPVILDGVLHASHNKNTFGQVWDLLNSKENDPEILNHIGDLFGGNTSATSSTGVGASLLKLLFGNNEGILNSLSGYAGFNNSGSAGKLLSLAAPFVMAFLRKKSDGENFGSSGLSTWLGGYKNEINAAIPTALATSLGFGTVTESQKAPPSYNQYESNNMGGGNNWWLWLVGLLAALGALWFMMQGCNKEEMSVKTENATESTMIRVDSIAIKAEAAAKATRDSTIAAIKAKWSLLGANSIVMLPGKVELNVPEKGVEIQLINWIQNKSKKVDKTSWFNFDRILFETGSANLNSLSMDQIGNMVTILKAFPAVELKVGGYTDNVGDAEANKALSLKRAEAVVAAVVTGGIDAKRLVAEGYGPDHPVASNDTEEGRDQNRRVAVRVTKK